MKTLADAIGKAVRPLLSCGCSHCRDAKKRATAAALDWTRMMILDVMNKTENSRDDVGEILKRIKEERDENASNGNR